MLLLGKFAWNVFTIALITDIYWFQTNTGSILKSLPTSDRAFDLDLSLEANTDGEAGSKSETLEIGQTKIDILTDSKSIQIQKKPQNMNPALCRYINSKDQNPKYFKLVFEQTYEDKISEKQETTTVYEITNEDSSKEFIGISENYVKSKFEKESNLFIRSNDLKEVLTGLHLSEETVQKYDSSGENVPIPWKNQMCSQTKQKDSFLSFEDKIQRTIKTDFFDQIDLLFEKVLNRVQSDSFETNQESILELLTELKVEFDTINRQCDKNHFFEAQGLTKKQDKLKKKSEEIKKSIDPKNQEIQNIFDQIKREEETINRLILQKREIQAQKAKITEMQKEIIRKKNVIENQVNQTIQQLAMLEQHKIIQHQKTKELQLSYSQNQSQIRRRNKDLQKLKEKNQTLVSIIADQQKEIINLLQQYDSKQKQQKTDRQKQVQNKQKILNLKEKIEHLNKTQSDILNQKKVDEELLEELKTTIEAKQINTNQIQDKLDQTKKVVINKKEHFEKLQKKQKAILQSLESNRVEIKKLQDKNQKFENKVNELNNDAIQLQTKKQKLYNELKQKQQLIATIDSKNKVLQDQMYALNAKIGNIQDLTQKENVQKKISQQIQTKKTKLQSLTNQNQKVDQEKTNKTQILENLEESLESALSKKKDNQSTIQDIDKQIEHLKRNIEFTQTKSIHHQKKTKYPQKDMHHSNHHITKTAPGNQKRSEQIENADVHYSRKGFDPKYLRLIKSKIKSRMKERIHYPSYYNYRNDTDTKTNLEQKMGYLRKDSLQNQIRKNKSIVKLKKYNRNEKLDTHDAFFNTNSGKQLNSVINSFINSIILSN